MVASNAAETTHSVPNIPKESHAPRFVASTSAKTEYTIRIASVGRTRPIETSR